MLTEQDKQKLDGIVQKMIQNKEPDNRIRMVVEDFKKLHDTPAPQPQPQPVKRDVLGLPVVKNPLEAAGKILESGANIVKRAVGDTIQTYQDTPRKVAEDIQAGAEDLSKGGVWNVAKGLGKGGLRTAADVAGAIFAPVSSTIGESMREVGADKALQSVADYAVEKSGITDQKWFQDFAVKHPNAAEDFDRALTLTMSGMDKSKIEPARMAGEAKSAIRSVADTSVKAGKAGAGATASVVKAPVRLTGEVGKQGVSQISGMNKNTISDIFQNPEMYTKENMANISRESIAKEVKTGLEGKISELDNGGKAYSAIRQNPEVITIDKPFMDKVLKQFGLKVDEKGKVYADTKSATRNKGDLNAIQEVYDTWGQKTDFTTHEFLNMRSDLQGLSRFDLLSGKSKVSDKVGKKMYYEANKNIRPKIVGLEELDNAIAPKISKLKTLRKDYLTKEGELKDGAINKIANLTGTGKIKVLNRLEDAVPGITRKISLLRSIEDIQHSKDVKVGTYVKGGIVAGSTMTGGLPGAIISMILTSPDLIVPILRAYGYGAKVPNRIVNSIIRKFDTAEKLSARELDTLDQAMRTVNEYYSKENIARRKMQAEMDKKPKALPMPRSEYKSQVGSGRTINLPERSQSTMDKAELRRIANVEVKKEMERLFGKDSTLRLPEGGKNQNAAETKKLPRKGQSSSSVSERERAVRETRKTDKKIDTAKLTKHINRKEWWRTAENESGKKERGQFLASSFREAEFYGRPLDKPFKTNIQKPLVGDEKTIMRKLGLEAPKEDISIEERFYIDKKMAQEATKQGYDAIALMSEKGFQTFRETGKIPRSIELNDLSNMGKKRSVVQKNSEAPKMRTIYKYEKGKEKNNGNYRLRKVNK